MTPFQAAVARLDTEADTRLGDPLFYHLGGIISPTEVAGFITDPGEMALIGLDAALDSVGVRRRLEISRTIVATPSKEDRIESDHPHLAGFVWRPSAWRATRGSRYWIMDLQKVG